MSADLLSAMEALEVEDPPKPVVPQSILDSLVTDGISLDYKFDIDGETPYSVTGKYAIDTSRIRSFSDHALGLDPQILENLQSAQYKTPTAIQRHGIAQIVAYNDVMGCSHTASGKTATYLLPMLNELFTRKSSPQAPNGSRDGQSTPTALILVPTRELAEQVNEMVKLFSAGLYLRSLAVYGGDAMGAELYTLRRNKIDVVVATPGRLYHILSEFGVLTLSHVEYLVIDEADEMFSRGFFPQIADIIRGYMGDVNDRTNIMFSATFPRQIQYYAQKFLRRDYTFVVVGIIGGASPDIQQDVRSVSDLEKGTELVQVLDDEGANKILIFCNTIEKVDCLVNTLKQRENLKVSSIHSGHCQPERDQALLDFNEGKIQVLVATSVAARGLNIKDVHCVVNYDFPKDIDDYVQRIGRARTVNEVLPAVAISFFDQEKDGNLVDDLLFVLDDAKQDMPPFLDGLRQQHRRIMEELEAEFPWPENYPNPGLKQMQPFPVYNEVTEDPDHWG